MKRMMKRILLTSLASVFLLSACSAVGPNYQKPEIDVPDKWRLTKDKSVTPRATVVKHWWEVFKDPLLTELIAEASLNNLDVRIAMARVEEARARLGVVVGDKYPVVDAKAEAGVSRDSEFLGNPLDLNHTKFSVGMDASWELDFFGRVRRSIEAGAADLQAVEESRIDVAITLYAEVAKTYLTIRSLQARLAAATGNIKSQKNILYLTQKKFKHGLATDLDVAQAQRILASSEAALPPLRIELNQAINNMGVLLGRHPGDLYEKLDKAKKIPAPPSTVAVGVPYDLIRRRPDIRKAERELAAQTARIGVATAELYPSFSLTGSISLGASDIGDLFNGKAHAYSFGPSMRWNIFNRDRIKQQIKVEDALTEQALLSYESTVLNALNEVENAIVAFLGQKAQYEAQKRAAKAARRNLSLAMKLYQDGLADFQDVLDAQRAVFEFENDVAAAEGDAAINVVRLYKALGGGWDLDKVDDAKQKNETSVEGKDDAKSN